MPDTKVSGLTAATPAGADLIYIVKGGASKKATITDVLALVPAADPAGTAAANRNVTVADATARAAAIPVFIGQNLTQTDTGLEYRATGLLAGNWTAKDRTALGLGTAAQNATSDFDVAGAAAGAVSAHNALATAHAAATNLVHPNDDTTLDELTLTSNIKLTTSALTKNPTSPMTSNVLPAPLVAFLKDVDHAERTSAFQAFDDNAGTGASISGFTITYPVVLKIDFGAGFARIVTQYALTAATSAPMVKDWTLEGSNDDATWTVLDTRTNVSWGAGQERVFGDSGHEPFNNTTAYRYYRINCSANNGDSTFVVVEFKLYVNNVLTLNPGAQTANRTLSVPVLAGADTIVVNSDSRMTDSRTPTAHQLDGALHTVSGLTAGHVLQALTPTTFGFAAPAAAGFTPTLFQIDFSAHLPTSKSGTSWTRANNYTFIKAFEYANSTNADLEWIEYTMALPAGTYTIDIAAALHTNGGILDLLIDGSSVGTVDLYNGSFVPANISQITGVVITAGTKAIRLKVSGKNGSSGGYQLYAQGITFRKTA